MAVEEIIKELDEYTRKFEAGDISKEEADRIFSFVYGLSAMSLIKNKDFTQALRRWYGQVEKKLPAPGNYVASVPLIVTEGPDYELAKLMHACVKKLDPADAIFRLEVNKEMSRIVRKKFREMKIPTRLCISYQAGKLRQALGDRFDDLVPVIEGIFADEGMYTFGRKIVKKAERISAEQAYGMLLSYIVYNSGVPAIFTGLAFDKDPDHAHSRISVFSKDRHMFSFPSFEEVFRMAKNAKIIDAETAERFLNGRTVENFSFKNFIDQMTGLLTMESRIKKEQDDGLEDGSWTDITR